MYYAVKIVLLYTNTMVRIRIFFLTLLLLTNISICSYAQNVGAHPTILEYALAAGGNESQIVNLTNGSDKKVQFKIYLNDWNRDSTGGHLYYDASTQARSCARWMTLDKSFVELEPGASTTLSVKMSIPDSAAAVSEMKWAMLFVETVEEQKSNNTKQAQAMIRNLLRIGIHIYQTPPNLTKKEIKAFKLEPVADNPKQYQLLCRNTGDVMLHCKSYLELTLMKDGTKTKLDPVEFPVFPAQKRYIVYDLPANLVKGKYSALAVVDAGEDISLEAVESTIEIK